MKIKELLSLFCLSSEVKAVYLFRAKAYPVAMNGFDRPIKSRTQTLTNLQDLSAIEDGEIESTWVNGKMLMIREKGC